MASEPEGTEPLKYQTSVLKVSIHCEGCKKKVKKVLRGLQGIYDIDIDSKQNKVSVTGSVDPDSLIRRLGKYGKHAELWQENKQPIPKSPVEVVGNAKAKDTAGAPAPTPAETVAAAPKMEQQTQNTDKKQQDEVGESKATPPSPTEATEIAPAVASADTSVEASSSNPKVNAHKSSDGDKQAKSDKKGSEKPASAAQTDVSHETGNDKQGKKVQSETSSKDERTVSDSDKAREVERTISNSDKAGKYETAGSDSDKDNKDEEATSASVIPPLSKQFPTFVQPVFTVSYNSVQPSTSYAYYTASPAAMPLSYAYYGHPPPVYPPESYSLDSYYGSLDMSGASGGSYDMFNDENPNACSLM